MTDIFPVRKMLRMCEAILHMPSLYLIKHGRTLSLKHDDMRETMVHFFRKASSLCFQYLVSYIYIYIYI